MGSWCDAVLGRVDGLNGLGYPIGYTRHDQDDTRIPRFAVHILLGKTLGILSMSTCSGVAPLVVLGTKRKCCLMSVRASLVIIVTAQRPQRYFVACDSLRKDPPCMKCSLFRAPHTVVTSKRSNGPILRILVPFLVPPPPFLLVHRC